MENGSKKKKKNLFFSHIKSMIDLPIQHSSFEQGLVFATSGGSTPI
jgi:hypothetical protein